MIITPGSKDFCFHCGDCCRGPYNGLTVTAEELALIERKTGKYLPHRNMGLPNRLFLVGDRCPFLDGNECSIYDFRFCQCRLYHCGRIKRTDKMLDVPEIRKLMARNPEYSIYKQRLEIDAVTWGNRHGWNWRKQ